VCVKLFVLERVVLRSCDCALLAEEYSYISDVVRLPHDRWCSFKITTFTDSSLTRLCLPAPVRVLFHSEGNEG